MNSFLAVVFFCVGVDQCAFYRAEEFFQSEERCQQHIIQITSTLEQKGVPLYAAQCFKLGTNI